MLYGAPTAERVARALHMSRRTMTRKLERERTTFNAELDAVRREMAVERVLDTKVSLAEIAFLLGFSHVESFHRAFRRWTGETPLTYRASRSPV
jgi:AraC-like DNA-binding protein